MFYISSQPEHNVAVELIEIHQRLSARYNFEQQALPDIKRAKIMTKYLRMFKEAASYNENENGNTIASKFQLEFDSQSMRLIDEEVKNRLGLNNSATTLFKRRHNWYEKQQKDWGADDVFEAELKEFLNIAVEQAISNNKYTQATNVGNNLFGNISQDLASSISNNVYEMLNNSVQNDEYCSNLTFRAAKTDINSFSITGDAIINPKWQEFINAFNNAKFTVKNYSSLKLDGTPSGYETIHLGNTNIAKAILGTLSNVMNNNNEILHVFFHSLNSYKKRRSQIVANHLLHLRFVYELTGGGLYDERGNKLDEADFFIYNDPASNNIYVRSTKEMICDMMKYMQPVKNPLHDDIVILKSSF